MKNIMIEFYGVNSHFIFSAPIDKPELVSGVLDLAKEAISIIDVEYDQWSENLGKASVDRA